MAIGCGADYVVGRPITKAKDPLKIIEILQQEISSTINK
jgi:orotidine-5'-phosphate decarboxylase